MSNVANQAVAVVATLLGFVAHELLWDRSFPVELAAQDSSSVEAASHIVMRAVDLGDISSDWLQESHRAEREPLAAPAARVPVAMIPTPSAPRHGQAKLAGGTVARVAVSHQPANRGFLR